MDQDPKLYDILSESRQNIDPFAVAKSKANTEVLSESAVMDMPNFGMPGVASTQPGNNQTMGGLFGASEQPLDKKVQEMLAGLKIDPKGIPMNPLGRNVLVGRLKKTFGDQFASANGVGDLLKTFDQYLGDNKQASQQGVQDLISQGKRTLGALGKL